MAAAGFLRGVASKYIDPGSAVPLYNTMAAIFVGSYTMELLHHRAHERGHQVFLAKEKVRLEEAIVAAEQAVVDNVAAIKREMAASSDLTSALAASRKKLMDMELDGPKLEHGIAKAKEDLAAFVKAQEEGDGHH